MSCSTCYVGSIGGYNPANLTISNCTATNNAEGKGITVGCDCTGSLYAGFMAKFYAKNGKLSTNAITDCTNSTDLHVTSDFSCLQIFELSKGPKICGCKVESGLVKVGSKARVRRSKELIYNGEVTSLRHFKEDVKEVKAGLECGIRLDNFADFVEGDEIEFYNIELKKASL